MPTEIVEATTDEDYAAFGDVVRTYEQWLRDRYASVPDLISQVSEHQDLAGELADLRGTYGPPAGVTLLARRHAELVGGVAYRDLGDGVCEMKRLFVLESAQGSGVGRELCRRLIAHAQRAGYRLMRLDTGSLNTEAIALYTELGFHERASYSDYPPQITVHLRFFERPL